MVSIRLVGQVVLFSITLNALLNANLEDEDIISGCLVKLTRGHNEDRWHRGKKQVWHPHVRTWDLSEAKCTML